MLRHLKRDWGENSLDKHPELAQFNQGFQKKAPYLVPILDLNLHRSSSSINTTP